MRRACIVLAFCLAAFVAVASADTKGQTLSAFTSVVDNSPFYGMIALANDSTYSINATAPKDFLSKFSASVSNSVLNLVGTGSFVITDQKPSYVARVPANTLQSFNAAGSSDTFLQGAALSNTSFSLTNSGTGLTNISNLLAPVLTVTASGTGDIVVSGSPANVTVTSDSVSSVYISGVTGSVQVDASGIGAVYVISANSGVKISGNAGMMSSVYYSQGTCSIKGCKQKSISLPKPKANPAMNDQLSVNG